MAEIDSPKYDQVLPFKYGVNRSISFIYVGQISIVKKELNKYQIWAEIKNKGGKIPTLFSYHSSSKLSASCYFWCKLVFYGDRNLLHQRVVLNHLDIKSKQMYSCNILRYVSGGLTRVFAYCSFMSPGLSTASKVYRN